MCTSEVIGEFDESSLRAVVCSDARFKAFIKLMEIYEELYRAISYSTVSDAGGRQQLLLPPHTPALRINRDHFFTA